VMIPDFAFTHKQDGRRALVEIVGFWHPEYLRRKVEKVRAAGRSDLILLVYEGVNLSAERLRDVPGEVLYFANKPVLKDVLAAVERAAK
jgi:predicted nuclease of restriction endonuclease-like RecB superfamily